MQFFEWILNVVGLYIVCGVVFAVAFVSFGVGRVDPAARATSLGFRLVTGC